LKPSTISAGDYATVNVYKYCITVLYYGECFLSSVVISVRIPRELKERLERLNVNVSEVVRELLEKYIEEAEERLLAERLRRLHERLGGRMDPALIARLVREDRRSRS
jgi:predicted DNA-binding protein